MSAYSKDTILKLKKAYPDDHELAPFNEVVVLGLSEKTEARDTEWAGQQADLVMITPVEFGPVIERQQGDLENDYTVESLPQENVQVQQPEVRRVQPGPTPEDQFREEEKKAKSLFAKTEEPSKPEVPAV